MSSASSEILKNPIRKIIRFGTGRPMPRAASKYKNRQITIDGHKFPSHKEGKRYLQLKLLQANGEIRDLQLQVPFRCEVNGKLICKYLCDFVYEEYRHGKWTKILDDAKGFQTDIYKLKKKLILAIHGFEIRES